MTAMPDVREFDVSAPGVTAATQGAVYVIDPAHWGYTVRSLAQVPLSLRAMQALCWLLGAGFLMAAIGMWVAPMMIVATPVIGFKVGATILCGAMAFFLMWFASRGVHSELQVDTALGELREVVRNRAGEPTLIGRYGFDAIGGVFLDRTDQYERLPEGHAWLMLRYRNTAQVLPVLKGPEAMLEPLRDRLGRDLMVEPRRAAMRRRTVAEIAGIAAE